MAVKEYKCPNCGGAVNFDSSSQSMKCPFCDTEFEIAALEEYQKQISSPAEDSFGKADENAEEWEDQDGILTGACPSCGAELIGDKNAAAMVCPNCNNVQIVTKRLEGMLKPNFVIPFKLDKKAATEALKKFYEGKKLLPDFFKEDNHVNSIQGVYLPFWLFDAKASGNIRYKASKTKSWSDVNYSYKQTDSYSIVRNGSMSFEKVPVDGSERMDDAYMDAIEPFDYSTIKDFETAYLAGYTAEKYDVEADKCNERAGKRIKATIESEFAKSVAGYASVKVESSTVKLEGGKINYALFPVWILNTKYNGENYLFLMNGQSGRLVGKLPVDNGKAWKFRLLYTGIIGVAATAILQLLRIFM